MRAVRIPSISFCCGGAALRVHAKKKKEKKKKKKKREKGKRGERVKRRDYLFDS